jgi:hypothetical protein
MSMPSVVILSHVIGFNHADLAGAEKEPLSSAAGLRRTNSRPCKAAQPSGQRKTYDAGKTTLLRLLATALPPTRDR